MYFDFIRIDQSPYSNLYNENYWKEIEALLMNETCKLLSLTYFKIIYFLFLGILPESALSVAITAGTLALPKFSKLSSITLGNKKKTTLNLKTEINLN